MHGKILFIHDGKRVHVIGKIIPHASVQREFLKRVEGKKEEVVQQLRESDLPEAEKRNRIQQIRSRISRQTQGAILRRLVEEREGLPPQENVVRGGDQDAVRDYQRRVEATSGNLKKVMPGYRKRKPHPLLFSEAEVNEFTVTRVNELLEPHGIVLGRMSTEFHTPMENMLRGLTQTHGKMSGVYQAPSEAWKKKMEAYLKKTYPRRTSIDPVDVLPIKRLMR